MPRRKVYRPPHVVVGKQISDAFRKLSREAYRNSIVLDGLELHERVRLELGNKKLNDGVIRGSLKAHEIYRNEAHSLYINSYAVSDKIAAVINQKNRNVRAPVSIISNPDLQAEYGMKFEDLYPSFRGHGIEESIFRGFLDRDPKVRRGQGGYYYLNPFRS